MTSMTPAYVDREATRRLRHLWLRIGEDVRRMRLDSGISLAALGQAVQVDPSHLSRIEAGRARPSVPLLTSIGIALGADLGVRYFDGSGPRLHDRTQAAMVEAAIRALDDRWTAQLEVPITDPARGVIDAVLADRGSFVLVAGEFCSDITRLEQLIRWSSEKADGLAQRRSTPVSRLLVVRSTQRNREIARRYRATLDAAYPARAREVVDALTAGAPWPGDGLIWMSVRAGEARLMRFPPRGVELGR